MMDDVRDREEITMVRIIKAVFDNGTFRPLEPVPYCPGETFDLVVASAAEASDPYLERMRAAKTLAEMYEIVDSAPDEFPPDYDIEAALNANRLFSGERPLLPEEPSRGTH